MFIDCCGYNNNIHIHKQKKHKKKKLLNRIPKQNGTVTGPIELTVSAFDSLTEHDDLLVNSIELAL